MATSVYASTEETTNACRACRLLLGPCTDELRDVLRHHVPPLTFPYVIVQKRTNLPRLTASQMNLILPRGSSYTGNYDDMDISLSYILLRNICGITPHSNGWGNDPNPSDRSLSANIERIRLARNQCVHSSSPILSNPDFNTIWSTVRSTVVDLDSFLSNGNQYEREVDFLRHETMDPVRDHHFIEELRKQAEEDAATREIVHGLKRKFEQSETDRIENQNKMQKVIDEIKRPKSVIPPNVKDLHEKDFIKWKEEDGVYSETHNFHAMFDEVRKQPYMTFVGVPGSGKTATIHHIALILQQEGYEVVPIKNIRKIEDYCDCHIPQVFVIDDVVGVLGLQKRKLETLLDYEKRISNPPNIKTKVLMSCREAVFNECNKSFFLNEKNVIRMHSSENTLNDDDKKVILQKHGLDIDLLSPTLLRETSDMFPLLCKLYSNMSKEEKLRNNVEKFFTCPVECLLKEFDKMQQQKKLYYATLVLCVLNDKKLSEKILKNTGEKIFCEMKSKVLESCEVESFTDAFKFSKALSAMKGTYTKLCGTEYTFVHDSMFEIVANHFGCQFPHLILQYISSTYIANSVKLQKCEKDTFDNENTQVKERVLVSDESKQEGEKVAVCGESSDDMKSFDLCIRLKEDQYPMLAERLYRDIENMELYDVFMNVVLKEPKVCQAFIEVLTGKSYTELKSLFLSVQTDVSKVVSKTERVVRERERGNESIRERVRQKVLLNERRGIVEPTYNVRVISWVVFYGHNQVLQYILQQTDSKKETQSELFWNPFNPELSFATKQKENNIETDNATVDKCLLNFIDSRNQDQDSNRQFAEKYRLLLLSCYSGDLKTVRIFLKYVDRNTINRVKQNLAGDSTPLTAACEGGHMSVVKELLEAGADVNLQRKYYTPLTAACKGGHMSVVKELLEEGADVNLEDGFFTPLTAACEGGYMSVVKELLEAGADVNPQCDDNNTPLIAACESGHMSVVKELLEAGADVNPQGKYITPLTAACEGGHMSVVKELLEAGADVNPQGKDYPPLTAACKGGHMSVVKELLEAGADVNPQGFKDTPLTAACKGGHMSVVKELLEAGADVNPQGKFNTPLTAACEGGHMSVVKELLEEGADVNPQTKFNTPLIAACKGGDVCLVTELLESGADVNPQSIYKTPLTAACEGGHISVVKELLEAGANVNPQGQNNTPLLAACEGGHMSVVKELLEAGADVNPQGNYNTPLTAACEGGHMCVVKELLEAGADVNLQSKYNTPLTAACKGGHMSVVKELLEEGADVNQEHEYNTPLTAACERGHITVAKQLICAGAEVNMQGFAGKPPLCTTVLSNTETLKPIVLMLNSCGADPTICDREGLSALYTALVINDGDVVKLLLQTESKNQCSRLKLHLFDCLVNLKHSDVTTDGKDDVVVTKRRMWRMKKKGDLYLRIIENDDKLKHLLALGLDVNQWIQLYDDNESDDVKPVLFILIDEEFISDKVEKVRILLEAGVDVNVRVKYSEYDSVLDRKGVSALERTQQLMNYFTKCKYSIERVLVPEYKRVLSELKKHVRRYSV